MKGKRMKANMSKKAVMAFGLRLPSWKRFALGVAVLGLV